LVAGDVEALINHSGLVNPMKIANPEMDDSRAKLAPIIPRNPDFGSD
jgi:hypothetical protein